MRISVIRSESGVLLCSFCALGDPNGKIFLDWRRPLSCRPYSDSQRWTLQRQYDRTGVVSLGWKKHLHLPTSVYPSKNSLAEASTQVFFIQRFTDPIFELTAQGIPHMCLLAKYCPTHENLNIHIQWKWDDSWFSVERTSEFGKNVKKLYIPFPIHQHLRQPCISPIPDVLTLLARPYARRAFSLPLRLRCSNPSSAAPEPDLDLGDLEGPVTYSSPHSN